VYYSQPLSFPVDDNLLAAWESVRHAPPLGGEQEIFPRFAAAYAKIRSLPRGARRALQRKLACSCGLNVSAAATQRLAASIAGAALLLALAQAAPAATITVNTNIPKIAGDGLCSLVEAIINANNDAATHADCLPGSGTDTIALPAASVHAVTGIYDTVYGSRLPVITSQIIIQGNGARITVKKSKTPIRLITVTTSGDLTLDHITLSGGAQVKGGAILNYGAVTIEDSTININIANYGGGIYNRGDVTIENSVLSGNLARLGSAIFNHEDGTASVQHSSVSGNRANRGALYNNGLLEVDNTTISKNIAAEHGGGVLANAFNYHEPYCTTNISNSIISSNSAHFDGGGIQSFNCTLTVENSTVIANKAGPGGGGISSGAAPGVIENSTISGNSAKYAGGIYGASLTLSNSTITGNKGKIAGGVYNRGDMTIKRTLVSGNKGSAAEVKHNGTGITVDNHNLFGTNGNAGVIGFTPGASDIIPPTGTTITKILGPLADNGGPTPTHALVPGSPAIDAAPVGPDCPSEDQRGIARPQGAACDIGAFEK